MFAKALVVVMLLAPVPLAAQQAKEPPQLLSIDRKAMLERAMRQQRESDALEAEVRRRELPRVPSPLIVLPQ